MEAGQRDGILFTRGTRGGGQVEPGAGVRRQIRRPVTRMAGLKPPSSDTCAAPRQACCEVLGMQRCPEQPLPSGGSCSSEGGVWWVTGPQWFAGPEPHVTHMGPTAPASMRLSGRRARELRLKKVTSLTTWVKLDEGGKGFDLSPGRAGSPDPGGRG